MDAGGSPQRPFQVCRLWRTRRRRTRKVLVTRSLSICSSPDASKTRTRRRRPAHRGETPAAAARRTTTTAPEYRVRKDLTTLSLQKDRHRSKLARPRNASRHPGGHIKVGPPANVDLRRAASPRIGTRRCGVGRAPGVGPPRRHADAALGLRRNCIILARNRFRSKLGKRPVAIQSPQL